MGSATYACNYIIIIFVIINWPFPRGCCVDRMTVESAHSKPWHVLTPPCVCWWPPVYKCSLYVRYDAAGAHSSVGPASLTEEEESLPQGLCCDRAGAEHTCFQPVLPQSCTQSGVEAAPGEGSVPSSSPSSGCVTSMLSPGPWQVWTSLSRPPSQLPPHTAPDLPLPLQSPPALTLSCYFHYSVRCQTVMRTVRGPALFQAVTDNGKYQTRFSRST